MHCPPGLCRQLLRHGHRTIHMRLTGFTENRKLALFPARFVDVGLDRHQYSLRIGAETSCDGSRGSWLSENSTEREIPVTRYCTILIKLDGLQIRSALHARLLPSRFCVFIRPLSELVGPARTHRRLADNIVIICLDVFFYLFPH